MLINDKENKENLRIKYHYSKDHDQLLTVWDVGKDKIIIKKIPLNNFGELGGVHGISENWSEF